MNSSSRFASIFISFKEISLLERSLKRINQFVEKFSKAKRIFVLDKNEKAFMSFASTKWGGTSRNKNGNEILIDVLPYHPYLFKAAYISNFLSTEYSLDIKTICADYSRTFLNRYLSDITKFSRMYRSFGCGDGLNYTSLSSKEICECEREAISLVDHINCKQSLLELEFAGIRIGDLIYDSYLRVNACATVDLNDARLLEQVKTALIICRSCQKYFENHKVSKIVLSHALYIQYGIVARFAGKYGIDTYLFPIRSQVVQKLEPPYFLHSRNHSIYRQIFSTLDNKEERLEQARTLLMQRLSGVIDPGTFYMSASAYSSKFAWRHKVLKETGRVRVIVMLHCFFDAPHFYNEAIFPDFYEWVDFTLTIAEQTNFDVYVKPHPNGLPGNDAIVEYFKNKYPKTIFIDKSIPNNQLIAEGIGAAITVNGTLGHEFPYLGVPVITAGDNPHSAYDFCNHAGSQAEYESLIRNADKLPRNIPKAEIEEFFYMHYLHPGYGRLEGNNDLFDFGKRNLYQEGLHSTILRDLMNEAEAGKFDDVIDRFAQAMRQVER